MTLCCPVLFVISVPALQAPLSPGVEEAFFAALDEAAVGQAALVVQRGLCEQLLAELDDDAFIADLAGRDNVDGMGFFDLMSVFLMDTDLSVVELLPDGVLGQAHFGVVLRVSNARRTTC